MRARNALQVALATVLALGVAPAGHACGHCKEDKIAATYDYMVVSAARRNGQTVVFTELHGSLAPTAKLEPWIRQQVEGCPGVIRGTARVSLEPAALSFACDQRQVSVPALLRGIGVKLARRGLKVSLIEAQAPPSTRPGAKS